MTNRTQIKDETGKVVGGLQFLATGNVAWHHTPGGKGHVENAGVSITAADAADRVAQEHDHYLGRTAVIVGPSVDPYRAIEERPEDGPDSYLSRAQMAKEVWEQTNLVNGPPQVAERTPAPESGEEPEDGQETDEEQEQDKPFPPEGESKSKERE